MLQYFMLSSLNLTFSPYRPVWWEWLSCAVVLAALFVWFVEKEEIDFAPIIIVWLSGLSSFVFLTIGVFQLIETVAHTK